MGFSYKKDTRANQKEWARQAAAQDTKCISQDDQSQRCNTTESLSWSWHMSDAGQQRGQFYLVI